MVTKPTLASQLERMKARFIAAYESGASYIELKEQFGLPAREIEWLRKRLGLPPRPAEARRVRAW